MSEWLIVCLRVCESLFCVSVFACGCVLTAPLASPYRFGPHIGYQSNNKLPPVSTFLIEINRFAGEVFFLVTQNIRLIYLRLTEIIFISQFPFKIPCIRHFACWWHERTSCLYPALCDFDSSSRSFLQNLKCVLSSLLCTQWFYLFHLSTICSGGLHNKYLFTKMKNHFYSLNMGGQTVTPLIWRGKHLHDFQDLHTWE